MHFCRKFEIVAIDTDKNTFYDHTYKTDIGPVYVAVPKQSTEYQYWKHTAVSLPV